MKFGKITAAVVASTLAVAPIAAQATVADRSAPISGSDVGGESSMVLGIFALLAVGVAIAASGGDDNDDDAPVSS